MGTYTGTKPNEVTLTVQTDQYGEFDIVAGWDPSLDRYYFYCDCLIHETTDDTDRDIYLYHNLDDPHAPEPFSAATSGVEYYKTVWNSLQLGVSLPDEFWHEFERTRFAVPPNPNTQHLMQR
jgi:hypothetical protein